MTNQYSRPKSFNDVGDGIFKQLGFGPESRVRELHNGPGFYEFKHAFLNEMKPRVFAVIDANQDEESYTLYLRGFDSASSQELENTKGKVEKQAVFVFRGIAKKLGSNLLQRYVAFYRPWDRFGGILFLTGPGSELGELEEQLHEHTVEQWGALVSDAQMIENDRIRDRIAEIKKELGLA